MFTKKQYKRLRQYKKGPIDFANTDMDNVDQYLLSQQYIQSAGDWAFAGISTQYAESIAHDRYEISQLGLGVLEQYTEQNYKDKIFIVLVNVTSAILASAATLFFQHIFMLQ